MSQEASFQALVSSRKQLQQFSLGHYESLVRFQDGICFKLNLGSAPLRGRLGHPSSTATCLESLLECAEIPESARSPKDVAREFADRIIESGDRRWRSDGSAEIYCRCRTLPLVVRYLSEYDPRIEQHLRRILDQLSLEPGRVAIGEATGNAIKDWYQPNGFHTFWTLQLLRGIEQRFPKKFARLVQSFAKTRFSVERIRAEMLLWAKQSAGYQMALHGERSSKLDSDQLAWGLTILMTFGEDFQTNLAEQDFIRHGLKCLFDEQTPIGIWRTGAPLFHYKKSGNAHCYIFETFAFLLRSALTDRKEGVFLRQILREYAEKLLKLWSYARSTAVPMPGEEKLFSWSSGHRLNRRDSESWATASVYTFSQYLRRLVGIWTREAASQHLSVSVPRTAERQALKMLADRGETWVKDDRTTAAEQLMTLFVNPARYFGTGNRLEPESKPIDKDQARAAILFGPPGTSKTTLVRSVADAIGWDYVELHASHFVAEGLPNVQSTANTIFDELLQLDRTVILFDEIDELVRAREKEPDAFGRFLTTSMLPKLAELWDRRKVIYFVATNYIDFFDPAVTRAQRFDALIHVAPPSYKTKISRLISLLKPNFRSVSTADVTADVEKALEAISNAVPRHTGSEDKSDVKPNVDLPLGCELAKLLLIRWDQLEELAFIIRRHSKGKSLTLNRKLLEESLHELSDRSLKTCTPFLDYLDGGEYERRDFGKVAVWEIQGTIPGRHKPEFKHTATGVFWQAPFGDLADFPCDYEIVGPGVVKCL